MSSELSSGHISTATPPNSLEGINHILTTTPAATSGKSAGGLKGKLSLRRPPPATAAPLQPQQPVVTTKDDNLSVAPPCLPFHPPLAAVTRHRAMALQTVECPVCALNLIAFTVAERELHVNRCLDAASLNGLPVPQSAPSVVSVVCSTSTKLTTADSADEKENVTESGKSGVHDEEVCSQPSGRTPLAERLDPQHPRHDASPPPHAQPLSPCFVCHHPFDLTESAQEHATHIADCIAKHEAKNRPTDLSCPLCNTSILKFDAPARSAHLKRCGLALNIPSAQLVAIYQQLSVVPPVLDKVEKTPTLIKQAVEVQRSKQPRSRRTGGKSKLDDSLTLGLALSASLMDDHGRSIEQQILEHEAGVSTVTATDKSKRGATWTTSASTKSLIVTPPLLKCTASQLDRQLQARTASLLPDHRPTASEEEDEQINKCLEFDGEKSKSNTSILRRRSLWESAIGNAEECAAYYVNDLMPGLVSEESIEQEFVQKVHAQKELRDRKIAMANKDYDVEFARLKQWKQLTLVALDLSKRRKRNCTANEEPQYQSVSQEKHDSTTLVVDPATSHVVVAETDSNFEPALKLESKSHPQSAVSPEECSSPCSSALPHLPRVMEPIVVELSSGSSSSSSTRHQLASLINLLSSQGASTSQFVEDLDHIDGATLEYHGSQSIVEETLLQVDNVNVTTDVSYLFSPTHASTPKKLSQQHVVVHDADAEDDDDDDDLMHPVIHISPQIAAHKKLSQPQCAVSLPPLANAKTAADVNESDDDMFATNDDSWLLAVVESQESCAKKLLPDVRPPTEDDDLSCPVLDFFNSGPMIPKHLSQISHSNAITTTTATVKKGTKRAAPKASSSSTNSAVLHGPPTTGGELFQFGNKSVSEMTTPEMKLAMLSFGLKPLSKAKMRMKLTELCTSAPNAPTYPRVASQKATSSSSKRTAKTASQASSFQASQNQRDDSGDDEYGDACSNPDHVSDAESDCSGVSSCSTMSKAAAKREKVLAAVKSDHELYRRILTYQPLDIVGVHKELKAGGLKCSRVDLAEFFDQWGVNYTTAATAVAKDGTRLQGKRRKH